jgi:sulfur-carrier protein
MAQITIKAFGMIAEKIDCSEKQMDISGNIADLKKQLSEIYPQLRDFTYTIAVNKRIATDETVLEKNHEIALLPPYSGG